MKNSNIRIHRILHALFASLLLLGFSHSASTAVFDYLTQPLTIGPNSISITTDGITATATAYHVEFDNNTSKIYGPFSTRFFETDARGFETGLSLLSEQDFGQQKNQNGKIVDAVGFDNLPNIPKRLNPLPSIQFALFSFDSPIDISQVIVDDVVNLDRDIWVAGGSSAPNLSLDLVNAFNGFNIINSDDDASDGVFIHTFTTLRNLSFLAVGTALPGAVGDVGPFAQAQPAGINTAFYINALNFQRSGAPVIPIPGAVWLFLSGLLGLWGCQRKMSKCQDP